MDKSIKIILESLNNQIDSNELTAALKADNFEGEYALSEDGISSIIDQTKGLLSVQSAINNPDIIEKVSKDLYPKHMKSALSKVEESLKPILDKLGVDYSKYEFISDAIKDIEPRLSTLGGEGDNKDLINSLNEDLRQSKEALTKAEENFQEELRKRDENILQEKLLQEFKSKATERPWAEAYSIPDVKDAILSKIWGKITAKAHLKHTDDGVIPMQKEFPDKELYDGNKVLTFQSLLEPELEPFLKKSTPENVNTTGTKADGKKMSEKEEARIREFERQKETYG